MDLENNEAHFVESQQTQERNREKFAVLVFFLLLSFSHSFPKHTHTHTLTRKLEYLDTCSLHFPVAHCLALSETSVNIDFIYYLIDIPRR